MPRGRDRGLLGQWRITWMERWDQAYLDLEVPAHITFRRSRLGSFQFGAVRGWIDYRISEDGQVVEFSWEGFNDEDPSCGRGRAALAGDRLEGRLFLHNGDDSAFTAERVASDRPRR